jgi:Ca2+-binding RTX toxin-like protein
MVGAASGDEVSASVPTCRGLPATVAGTAGDDTLRGTARGDVIVGGGGLDVIL